ncbi:MAG TPA: hypothetical protein VGK73_09855, partial [Polyangiaceae bacterium]
SFALAGFLLPVTFIVVIFGENPSRVIDAIQYVAIAGAVLTVFIVLRQARRSWREPVAAGENLPTALQWGWKASRRPLVAILVAAFGIFFFSTGSFFGSHTPLGIFRFPRWLFELVTTPIASDLCLVQRGLELPPPPLFVAHGPEPKPDPRLEAYQVYSIPEPDSNASDELTRRGRSTAPALAQALERILERGNPVEEAGAVVFMMNLARWTNGTHPILKAWETASPRPPGYELIGYWRTCLTKNRSDHVGYRVNSECEFIHAK